MNGPTRSDQPQSTAERLAIAIRDLDGQPDSRRASHAALRWALQLSGADGGEIFATADTAETTAHFREGTERGGRPRVGWDLTEGKGSRGRLTLWGEHIGGQPEVEVVVAHLATLLRAAGAEEREAHQGRYTRRLVDAVRALRDAHPTEQAVLLLLREAQQMAGASSAALVTGLPGDPGPVVSVGIDKKVEPALLDVLRGPSGVALTQGDPWTGPLATDSPLRSDKRQAVAAWPVGGSRERIGTLVLLVPGTQGVDEHVLDAVSGLADHGSTVLGSAALRERLEELATVDPATRYFNERYFATRLEQETHRALRSNDIVSLLVVHMEGIDALKATQGAAMAERAVGALAEFMVPRLRATDIGCRTAPHEFSLILPSAGGLDAYLVGERIRAGFSPDASLGWGITLSLGVATFPDPAGTADQLDAFAHAAVDFARRNGGDRVFLYNREVAADIDAADQRARAAAESLLSTISALAAAIDERHPTTRVHSQNVARLSALLAQELGMPGDHTEHVRLAGLLHDIGKIGVTDELLVRPGPLTEDEWHEMRQHPEIAHRMLSGSRLTGVPEWVRCHQERPDGTGYPRGLAGDAIPVEAGIVAVANALDTMLHDRPYRPAHSLEYALDQITAGSGTQFIPTVVDALMSIADRDRGLLSDPTP